MAKRAAFVLTAMVLLCACGEKERAALFPVRGTAAGLVALGGQAAAGYIDFAKPKKLEYRFETPPAVSPPASLEIEYTCSLPPSAETQAAFQLVLACGDDSWVLPMQSAFPGETPGDTGALHYAVPLAEPFAGRLIVSLAPVTGSAGQKTRGAAGGGRFQIQSLAFRERWFGYYREDGETRHVFSSPFVYKNAEGAFVIEPPPFGLRPGSGLLPALRVFLAAGATAAVETGGRRFEAAPGINTLDIPAGMIDSNEGAIVISGDRTGGFKLDYAALPPFPLPITADPGMVLAWPQQSWRTASCEVFRWSQFPSLLIFDFADYAVQDRTLKRLAFFVEKAGFRGRLAADAEIADLHGWNAHDYRASDLARFFEAARAAKFPLLAEERQLEQILFNEGIIRRSASDIEAGEGGIISVSRESASYLRSTFMVHEAFHGLFFIDADFRAFSRERWERLPPAGKRFITSYFDYQHYDITDEYLLVNEFMAHVLQQPLSQAGAYFGKTIASRIDASPWRRSVLPEKDGASDTWPELAAIFTREAQAFSAYVASRWGLAAGRVRQVNVRQP